MSIRHLRWTNGRNCECTTANSISVSVRLGLLNPYKCNRYSNMTAKGQTTFLCWQNFIRGVFKVRRVWESMCVCLKSKQMDRFWSWRERDGSMKILSSTNEVFLFFFEVFKLSLVLLIPWRHFSASVSLIYLYRPLIAF